jgi:hypothetical protein
LFMSELKCVVAAMCHVRRVPPGPGIDFSVAYLLSVRTVYRVLSQFPSDFHDSTIPSKSLLLHY